MLKYSLANLHNRATRFIGMVIFVLLPTLATNSQAQYTYVTENGAITITKYTGSNRVVTVPSTIDGLPVTSIGEMAFYSTPVTSVTLPNSVTNLGEFVFGYCASLTNVVLSDNLTILSRNTFFGSTELATVTLPQNLR